MTDTKKSDPREFWIYDNGEEPCLCYTDTNVLYDDVLYPEKAIRVIEYRPYQALEEKLRIAVEALENLSQSQIAIGPEGELETLWEIKFSESIMMALDAIQAIKEIK